MSAADNQLRIPDGAVDDPKFDPALVTSRALSGILDHSFGRVDRDYLSAQIRHLAGELSVTAGSIKNGLATGDAQKT